MLARSDQIIRAPRDRTLSEDQLRAVVPAIFADRPHDRVSDRYTYLSTIDVVRGLERAGFGVVEARQSRTRDESRREYTKHMLRFRYFEAELTRVGDTLPEALLVNAHDGSSRYKLMSGLFKLLCSNGLVIPAGPFSEVSVRHVGDIVENVVEATQVVLENAQKSLEKPREWSQIDLTPKQREAFAEGARVLRFGDAEGNVTTPIRASQLLEPRRSEDTSHDLWTTFNVVQENTIRGGLSGFAPNNRRNARRSTRRVTSREVRGIDQDVKLNRALWVMAEKLAESVA